MHVLLDWASNSKQITDNRLSKSVNMGRRINTDRIKMELRWRRNFSFETRMQAHIGIPNEIVEDSNPRRVNRQVVIELGRDFSNFWQVRAANKRKIVMFDMATDVERNHINRAIITVRFLTFRENIVIRNKMAGQRMNTQAHHETEKQIYC